MLRFSQHLRITFFRLFLMQYTTKTTSIWKDEWILIHNSLSIFINLSLKMHFLNESIVVFWARRLSCRISEITRWFRDFGRLTSLCISMISNGHADWYIYLIWQRGPKKTARSDNEYPSSCCIKFLVILQLYANDLNHQ